MDTRLSDRAIGFLYMFDILFLLDRLADLFVGFTRVDGTDETNLVTVMYTNMSSKLLIEIIIGFGPYMVGVRGMHTIYFFFFKAYRCTRLFEMDNHINEVIEVYGQNSTRAETQLLRGKMEVLFFFVNTLIDLHLLTCI